MQLPHFKNERTPIPAGAKLAFDPVDDAVTNSTGIVTKCLVDLQRLLLCGMVGSSALHTNAWKKRIGIIVASSASARVSLIFKANSMLRTCVWDCLGMV